MTINLRREFGSRYKISYERSRTNEKDDASRMYLDCRFGVIVPHGDSKLAAIVTDSRIAKHLSQMPAIIEDPEDVFAFALDDFDQIAHVMKPTKR
jgi:hypothetical protein